MKTSKLSKFAWVVFALTFTTSTLLAQGWGNRPRYNSGVVGTCIEQISDLTQDQKVTIQKLRDSHMETMSKLREERRSTSSITEKENIRNKMLTSVEAHHNAVKQILTEVQLKDYENYLNSGGNSNSCRFRRGSGKARIGNGYMENQNRNMQGKGRRGKGKQGPCRV